MATHKEYVANWLISGHRGKDIVLGQKVRMSDEDAAPLLACGALSVAGEQDGDVEDVSGEDAAE